MPRVGRIHVSVEIVDDDGTTTIHEAYGEPDRSRNLVANLVPHDRMRISRSSGARVAETVEVGVRLEATLTPVPGARLFGVDRGTIEDDPRTTAVEAPEVIVLAVEQ